MINKKIKLYSGNYLILIILFLLLVSGFMPVPSVAGEEPLGQTAAVNNGAMSTDAQEVDGQSQADSQRGEPGSELTFSLPLVGLTISLILIVLGSGIIIYGVKKRDF